ncbi:YcnI family protein [Micromonospora globbae]|uniref:YcnI family protein n=1 Tax=Micromonospora globbae TaxID=1894969 RepID=UPI0038706A2B|nr:YcnI family protein [Micromonospora globbae]
MATTRGDRRRAAGAAATLLAVAVLGWPGTAYAAQVTTTPSQARQGDAVRLEFVVPEERTGTRTRQVEVRLPADTPIAEVYPMSVPGWAPRITSRTLDEPVAGLHAGGVSTVTTAVTWIRVGEAGAGPARLPLSMGPLPRTGRLTFPVIQTYADGTVVRWADTDGAHRAPVLTLLPADPGGGAGHAGHGAPAGVNGSGPDGAGAAGGSGPGGGSAPGGADGSGPGGAGTAARPDDGGGAVGRTDLLLATGLLAGLAGGAAIGWLASRWRRRSSVDGAASTGWRLPSTDG